MGCLDRVRTARRQPRGPVDQDRNHAADTEDVVRWSETLSGTYLQGAFARAVQVSDGRAVVRNHQAVIADVAVSFDPFDIWPQGETDLRARLSALTRPELLAMIQKYDLNPAGQSLTRLSDAQLVTFIVTAVDVQSVQGRQ